MYCTFIHHFCLIVLNKKRVTLPLKARELNFVRTIVDLGSSRREPEFGMGATKIGLNRTLSRLTQFAIAFVLPVRIFNRE